MNNYLNDRKAIDRLKREYLEYGNLIIGFDFDCTIYDYHKEDLEIECIIKLLEKCSDLGFTMCLYSLTLKDSELDITDKIIYCNSLGIGVDYINASPIMNIDQQKIGHYPHKPFFSILLDDRAGLSASYNILLTTLKELNLYEN